jgi:alpha-beta hydrolase superfamily lysophospholipase
MQRLSPGRLACGMLAALVFTWMPHVSRAADNSERVKFDTADGVEIHGTFYPSNLGAKAACVMMLHSMGGNCEQEGWSDLAKKLQAKDFAVLMFDFRGHGDSLNVSPGFWQTANNQTLKNMYRNGKLKEQINYKDFTTQLNWMSLATDISAAKHFLDRKNDNSECNSANVVVLGAEGGAALGTLWIWDTWNRRRVTANGGLAGFAGSSPQAEGQDVACALWLSITDKVGVTSKYTIPVDTYLLQKTVRDKVPMYFLYGDQDLKGRESAKRMIGYLHPNSAPKLKHTGQADIKEGGKLQGRELLGKPSLNTEDLILKYFNTVMESRGKNAWIRRDAERVIQVPIPVENYLRRN